MKSLRGAEGWNACAQCLIAKILHNVKALVHRRCSANTRSVLNDATCRAVWRVSRTLLTGRIPRFRDIFACARARLHVARRSAAPDLCSWSPSDENESSMGQPWKPQYNIWAWETWRRAEGSAAKDSDYDSPGRRRVANGSASRSTLPAAAAMTLGFRTHDGEMALGSIVSDLADRWSGRGLCGSL